MLMGLGRIFRKKFKGKSATRYIKINYFRDTFKVPRWGYDKPPHELLHPVIAKNRADYQRLLKRLRPYGESFLRISKEEDKQKPHEPYLNNSWLPIFDSFSLYALLSVFNPPTFMEVGSGNSTKFARRAIKDNKLRTRIISIDPEPRAEIDSICDEVIRRPVEEVEPEFFERLKEGDFLFIDNSHRCFMNSDVTAVFIDIVPRLKGGVIIQFHDIFLPADYPPRFGKRFYSEQYLLAAYLLSGGDMFADIILPNNFIINDPELNAVIAPLFMDESLRGVEGDGSSFWVIKGPAES